jgi:nitrite reductase/ring-hydroxylating ferredoxin subunit
MDPANEIVAREDVPADGTLLFTVHENHSTAGATGDGGDGGSGAEDATVEGILLELADGVVAFENYCQHWRDVRLDSGDGASMRNGEIVCEKHGAYFESDTGYCNFGPCKGAYLEEIEITVADGTVYLADERYGRPRLGPAGEDTDAAGSRIGFSGN